MEGDSRRMAGGIRQAVRTEIGEGHDGADLSRGSGYGHRRPCLVGDVVPLGLETVGLCAVTFLVIGLTLLLLAIAG
jgi:hypothetical protein